MCDICLKVGIPTIGAGIMTIANHNEDRAAGDPNALSFTFEGTENITTEATDTILSAIAENLNEDPCQELAKKLSAALPGTIALGEFLTVLRRIKYANSVLTNFVYNVMLQRKLEGDEIAATYFETATKDESESTTPLGELMKQVAAMPSVMEKLVNGSVLVVAAGTPEQPGDVAASIFGGGANKPPVS